MLNRGQCYEWLCDRGFDDDEVNERFFTEESGYFEEKKLTDEEFAMVFTQLILDADYAE